MSKAIQKTNSRQPVEIIQRNSYTLYRLPYCPDELWVAGIDISRSLEMPDPKRHASDTFSQNKEYLDSHSRLIQIPRNTAKRGPVRTVPLLNENVQEVRVYDEIGFNFFISLCKTKKAKQHTIHVMEDYSRLKKQLRRVPKTVEWQQARDAGKEQRRSFTDKLKDFVEYAKMKGSHNGAHYYNNFTRKINKLLFDIHSKGTPENFRDNLTKRELAVLSIVEELVLEYVQKQMDADLDYHTIYKNFDHLVLSAKSILSQNLSPKQIANNIEV